MDTTMTMVPSLRDIRNKIMGRMGLKFVLTLSLWIAVLMLLVTLFITKIILINQERALQAKGRELGAVIARLVVDRVVLFDQAGLDAMVEESIAASPEMYFLIIVNAKGTPLTRSRSSFNRALPEVKTVLEARGTDEVNELSAAIRRELHPVEVAVDVTLEGSKLGEMRIAYSRTVVRTNSFWIAFVLLGTMLVIVAGLSVLVYVMVRRMIVAPTSEAEAIASRIASGDLTRTVSVKSADEIGSLGEGLNRMITGLRGMVRSLRESSGNLDTVAGGVTEASTNIAAVSRVQADALDEAAASVKEMHRSLKEIAENAEDLDERAQHASAGAVETSASVDEVAHTLNDLSASIEETSNAITQMSAAIRQIAEHVQSLSMAAEQTASSTAEISASVREVEAHARQSASLAEAVSDDAQKLGMPAIEKTIEGMRRIEEESRRAADATNRLGARAESIGGILTVIEEVTDQTSLLALNAAILAAQAGEHGKGFAVVAAEIRELANRTASSTKEIGSLITAVQEESRSAVEVMRAAVDLTDAGVGLARDAGDTLLKILERTAQSRDMSSSISRATAQQTTGMNQVSDAVDQISTMAHEIAKATAEQRARSEQISRAADRMREITQFVTKATAEQMKATKGITEAMGTMSAKVGMVNRGAAEVKAGSDLIVSAIDRIRSTARDNTEMTGRLNSSVEVLARQTAMLRKEIEKFTTEDHPGSPA